MRIKRGIKGYYSKISSPDLAFSPIKTKKKNNNVKHGYLRKIRDNSMLREFIQSKVGQIKKISQTVLKNKNLRDYSESYKSLTKRYE